MDNYYFVLYTGILLIGLSHTQFIDDQGGTNNTLRIRRQSSFTCTLPVNGECLIDNGEIKPGEQIWAERRVNLSCKPGYRLNPNNSLIVCDSNWDPANFPKCEKKCPAFYSTVTTKIACIDEHINPIPCDQAIHGSYLTINCEHHHEVPPGYANSLYCENGTWNFPKPVCQPVCGVRYNFAGGAWGGTVVRPFEYPWAVAVYKRMGHAFQIVCGGTLVSRRVVITAAHCVTDDYGNPLKQEDFKIAAGKFYKAIDDPRDELSQIRELSKLIVHDGFRGESQKYVADIAILVTKQLIEVRQFVQPVCINNVNDIHLSSNQVGEVAGWGLTQNNEAADRLQVIEIPFKERATCIKELPSDWESKYFFPDKICAGHYKKNISVCEGDSGSGLVSINPAYGRYYIHGLVSLAPKLSTSKCNYETNALYTSISFYYDFVVSEMRKNYVEDCELPQHPRNGRWQIENDEEKKPEDIVPSTTILKFSCDRGYILSSGYEYHECGNTYNTPTCDLLCPQLPFPVKTRVICKNSREETIDCRQAVEGSSITYTCPDGFLTDLGSRSSTRYCIGGSYGYPIIPNCHLGHIEPKTTTYSSIASDGLKVICTYFSSTGDEGVVPEDFDATLCTHIVYDFKQTLWKGDYMLVDHHPKVLEFYNRTINLKKKNPNLKVLLNVGGNTAKDSSYFKITSSLDVRTEIWCVLAGYFLKKLHFDGINIDWQYLEVGDEEIYIRFLEIIKENFNRHGWLLSASVPSDFHETGYNPTAMNRILDWVTIKNFNIYGLPAVDEVAKEWLEAGLTKENMVISVAFNGIIFKLKDENDRGVGPNISYGHLNYYEICSEYVYGFNKKWDDERKIAYKYNNTVWIGFNSAQAVRMKGEYIKRNGYAGVNVFPIDGDDNKGICGQKHVLLKNLHVGMGHPVLLEN